MNECNVGTFIVTFLEQSAPYLLLSSSKLMFPFSTRFDLCPEPEEQNRVWTQICVSAENKASLFISLIFQELHFHFHSLSIHDPEPTRSDRTRFCSLRENLVF